jgi:hypothetical protein
MCHSNKPLIFAYPPCSRPSRQVSADERELAVKTLGSGIIIGRILRPLEPVFRRDNQLLPLSNQKRKENYENNQSHAWRGFGRGVVLDFGMRHAA